MAPSPWKTGIAIERTFWDAPVQRSMRPVHGAVGRLSDEQVRAIEGEIRGR